MSARFFCPGPFAAGSALALPAETFHHAVRVRRLREGDALVLFAGDGCEAEARLVRAGRDGAEVEILAVNTVSRESGLALTLLQGLSSADRMDYTLQKAVELGATAIVPLQAQRSIVKLDGERAEKRRAHWQQVVVSACEQSGRTVIPAVAPLATLGAALAAAGTGTRFVLSVAGGARLRDLEHPADGVTLLAGPEGGLTDDEEAAARRAGFAPVSLGPRVLRTETAAVAALAAIQALWGDA